MNVPHIKFGKNKKQNGTKFKQVEMIKQRFFSPVDGRLNRVCKKTRVRTALGSCHSYYPRYTNIKYPGYV